MFKPLRVLMAKVAILTSSGFSQRQFSAKSGWPAKNKTAKSAKKTTKVAKKTTKKKATKKR